MAAKRISARARLADEALTPMMIERVARRILPRRNDYTPMDGVELLAECLRFGIRTRRQLASLLKRHRVALRAIDQGPLSPLDQRVYRAEYGNEFVAERIRRQYFFNIEGLIRIALEREFGEEYVAFYQGRNEAR